MLSNHGRMIRVRQRPTSRHSKRSCSSWRRSEGHQAKAEHRGRLYVPKGRTTKSRAEFFPLYTMGYTLAMAVGPDLIRRARREAGLTQVELARRAATSQSAVAAYESGAKTPNVETLERLLRAAGQRLGSGPSPTRKVRSSRLARRLRRQRNAILRIAREHHASNVRVFGSVARGQATSSSDIDLLVDMAPDGSLLDQVRLRRALIELLGVEVDVVSSNGLLPRDAPILDEAVPL